jgi:hypothetical protein
MTKPTTATTMMRSDPMRVLVVDERRGPPRSGPPWSVGLAMASTC